jgi:predicted RNase H-like HicB family nuclease
MKLHVTIERDETGYFVAEAPALPGCLSQGETYEEALANIREAIEAWFEVMESKSQFDGSHAVTIQI